MQTHTLSPELYWLTITTLMTGLMWVPYILNRLAEKGPLKATWDPQGDTTTRGPWADRMMRAHQNAVENLGFRKRGTDLFSTKLKINLSPFSLSSEAQSLRGTQ